MSDMDCYDVAIGVAILRRQCTSSDGALFADVIDALMCDPESIDDVAGRIVALHEKGMVDVCETVRVSPEGVGFEYGFRISPDYEGFFKGMSNSCDIY